MGGSGTTIAVGGLTIGSNGTRIGDGRVLENKGDAEWLSGVIDLRPLGNGNPLGGIIRNDVGATFNQRFNRGMIQGDGTSLFDNLGAYYKGGGVVTGPTNVISAAFNNAGELHINDQAVQITGKFTDSGNITVTTGATLNIVGDLLMQSTSVLDIGIGNTGVGLLTVSGLITLNGTLNAVPDVGFAPTAGQTFKFLTFGTKAGAFTKVGGTALGGGLILSLDAADTNDLRFDVVTAPTTASSVRPVKTSRVAKTSGPVASAAPTQATGTR
jgi:hypothetical protein